MTGYTGRRRRPFVFPMRFAQAMVLINGVIITLTAFFVFSYMFKNMAQEEFSRSYHEASASLSENMSELENTIRLVTSIIFLSESSNRDAMVSQIRRNVKSMSLFDQMIWLYQDRPGSWQYKVIVDGKQKNAPDSYYRMVPDAKLISYMLQEKIFSRDNMRIISDFSGMQYTEERKDPLTKSHPFAMIKTVNIGDYKKGVVIGVTRASVVLEQRFTADVEGIARMTIYDESNGEPLYHMSRNLQASDQKNQKTDFLRNYILTVGDHNWKVVLEFVQNKSVLILQLVPYIILFFGVVLTGVGTLFVRNNERQSQQLYSINKKLEDKNKELEDQIEERERLNTALVQAERDNRAIIDSVSDIIFETDVDGSLLFLSASWAKVTGFNVERVLEQNLFLMLYPADQEKQRGDFDAFVSGKKEAYHAFTRLRIADGTFRAIEIAFSVLRKGQGGGLRVVGTITDVEERRRAERALAEAEKKYRTIVENAAGGLYQLTPEGLYLSANPAMARILGYDSPEELLRLVKNANGTVYQDVSERKKLVDVLVSQDELFGCESQVIRKNGERIWVRENIRAVKDEQGHILYFEGSMEDITKRKEADIALMEAKINSDMANRAKTEFISNMSHELRTPLNAIIGFSDIMRGEIMGPLGQDVYKEYVEDIFKSGTGLLKIINEILDISKIEAGNRDLKETEFELRSVLDSTFELYGARIKNKAITLTESMKQLPVLRAEELSIKQVIGNIFTNAIKYTPSGGRITIFANKDADNSFRMSFSDTGIGMSRAEIDKALSPFGQVDNALDRSGDGVGLGLPLAQAMMNVHGGRLEVLSEKGIGTTVTLIFPPERVIYQESNETVPGEA